MSAEQSTEAPVETKKTFISTSEIEKHIEKDDLWMVINGKVYDITPFVDEHPGGEEVLVDCGGQDATTSFEDVGHSDDATEILEKLYVGDANPEEYKVKIPKPAVKTASGESSSSSSILLLIIAAVVAAGAFIYLQTFK
ncbi:uncharacterized protein SAPINGB_P004195 [Magnusiomyces paraingens]|uniref:Cytochrome b5 heme-binding domain-containing protein n=1 Tax=Magnusiomyces paraingens TaxID=2606893 RepID=A0A5E8BT53_9ASCO|nr:uncharacterized protein SAPINGB_P004195 [Saprochaete ingens]VVT54676.1 unnamed protein product [Saprochaete ingens]